MLSSLKLIDLVERNAEAIARKWVKDVKKNPRTTHYRKLSDEEIIGYAIKYYHHLRELMMEKSPEELAKEHFSRYARVQYEKGIPLHEALYALVLMRRHMWLYAEFQAAFVSVLEHQQAIDSISRTILMSDYIVYMVTQEYEKLIRHDLEKRLGAC
jgi:hypothetical protein